MRMPVCLFVIAFSCGSFCSALQARDYHLYYMGGQSNMVGFGKTDDLPKGLDKALQAATTGKTT